MSLSYRMVNRFQAFWHRRGSWVLMWMLIAIILASPVADAHPKVGALLALVVLFSVLLGINLGGNRKVVIVAAIPMATIWLIARLLEEFGSGVHPYNHLAHATGLALSCTLLWAVFDRMSKSQEVTGSIIAEAAINYLIIAIAFSQLYWILNELMVQPFNQTIPPAQGTTFLYFSMVTLTSVGYGVVAPVNPFVRLVAAFESMTGIFYVAVVVARLISSYRPLR